MIQLVGTDFDGTIFDAERTPPIPLELLEWLRCAQARGIPWVICSGREYPESVLDRLSLLNSHRLLPNFIICAEREIHALREGDYQPDTAWNFNCQAVNDAFFVRAQEIFGRIRRWIKTNAHSRCYEDAWSPLNIVARDEADADHVHQYLLPHCQTSPDLSVARNGTYFRLASCRFGKGIALAEIARCVGVTREHVFAVGDNFNDLTMLDGSCAALVAAPANAVPEVKDTVSNAGGYLAKGAVGHGVLEALEFLDG